MPLKCTRCKRLGSNAHVILYWTTSVLEDQALFRRITPAQLEASGDALLYLKKQAVLLFQKVYQDVEVNLDDFNVSLAYKDSDGDLTIIYTSEDLTAALDEFTNEGKIKILAQVQEKTPVISNDATTTSHAAADSSHDDSSSHSDDEPLQIIVQGAGCSVANGIYSRDGFYENAYKFTRPGKWYGNAVTFHIFLYKNPSNYKRWFITAVPAGK